MRSIGAMLLSVFVLLAVARNAAWGEEERILNAYNWSDYIGETTIADFEKEYGIKVNYDFFDSNETLNAKLLTGRSGYDIVFPSAAYFAREIKAGVYRKLDKSALTNLNNLDPKIVTLLATFDPGNEYAVPYMFYTTGFMYNVDLLQQRLKDAPTDSLQLLFDPEVVSKFADCGVTFFDSPIDVFQLALIYLGKDPNSEEEAELEAALNLIMKVRPFIRNFDSSGILNALASGDTCIAMSWSGDYVTASTRAREAGSDIHLGYSVPIEGSVLTFDAMMIPADAPHPNNAQLFLNYMLRPDVIAKCTNFTNYASANKAARAFVDRDILNNPAIYPDDSTMNRLTVATTKSDAYLRLVSRYWLAIKAGG